MMITIQLREFRRRGPLCLARRLLQVLSARGSFRVGQNVEFPAKGTVDFT